ncbi:MAG: chemotaxis response regulator protein-glutamate methylesterase [Nitrospinae bacterium RIFCSPLOWO2_01_FULL_39_10]|nr:MAG: chemotaxis response regulator protein-glutamate methylesterase [Nitrospinae bacterium RIFCSPLOWO2_01_FULL_39_10]
MAQPIKVLIVDDSAFMRKALSSMLESDSEIKVIGTARDGMEGIEKIPQLKPDIVTLDIEMPRMNGLEALRIIMEKMPLPVLMVSSLTEDGAKATLDALSLGAIDFIPKDLHDLSLNIVKIRDHLIEKIKTIARKKHKFKPPSEIEKKVVTPIIPRVSWTQSTRKANIVAIGTSTGGPKALQEVLPLLPKDFPIGGVIVQHMPPAFIGPFAQRLNQLSQVEVKEATAGDIIKPGLFLIAPGGYHMHVIRRKPTEVGIELTKEPADSLHRPSVDEMMLSVAKVFPGNSIGVILTGMGQDGLEGIRAIKAVNGRTIAEAESTCIVYGMPRAIVDNGLADKITPLPQVAGEILNMV